MSPIKGKRTRGRPLAGSGSWRSDLQGWRSEDRLEADQWGRVAAFTESDVPLLSLSTTLTMILGNRFAKVRKTRGLRTIHLRP